MFNVIVVRTVRVGEPEAVVGSFENVRTAKRDALEWKSIEGVKAVRVENEAGQVFARFVGVAS